MKLEEDYYGTKIVKLCSNKVVVDQDICTRITI